MTEYVGLDVSKEETSLSVTDGTGSILWSGKARSDPDSLFAALKEHTLCPERIVLETGTLSNWLARGLRTRGLAVDVIDARQAHAVMKLQHNKTDANDARLLAEIARSGFYRPVSVSGEEAQKHRMLIKARRRLVGQRRSTQNAIRGFLGALGIRFPKGSGKLAQQVRAALEEQPDLAVTITPLLASAEDLGVQIQRLEKQIIARAREMPACRLLMTVPGVGPITALTFIATIDDARRFSNSRAVGAYAGLTSRRYQSGEMGYTGRISKHGDGLLRGLLYEAANSMLTIVRKSHPLKDWARRIKKRSSHKKACVALARKLAVLLHNMLITGEPFRWPAPEEKDARA
jgi:transposase